MTRLPPLDDARIAVIGLGYVGLPLAVALGRKYPTVGFDVNAARVQTLLDGRDETGEVADADLRESVGLRLSSDIDALAECNVFIVAVPTPIDASRRPNLAPLIAASEVVGRYIRQGGVVVYESTVYPGATEEDCLPIVERESGLTFNRDFFAGYSPERVNPGDKARPLTKIVKVTSGSTPEAADFIDALYASIIEAGTYRASSIRVAEAAKIIENTQRDVNIALVNELAIVFSHLGIDTNEVIEAAATKWNFIKLKPGLVGGHCIGVDPYYLVHKSMSVGYIPDIIRSAREINDGMARHAASRLVKTMIQRGLPVKGAQVLVVGVSFKENCPDIRNSKVIDLLSNLREYGLEPHVVDGEADPDEVRRIFGANIDRQLPRTGAYQAVVVAVPHDEVVAGGVDRLRALLAPDGVLFDLKAAFPIDASDLRL
ncbi:nucleotide sugar dehydrogenase [Brevundimonas sp. VNH65]|uniref:nucleotide sugar dehydrogenase n=1 Tax=Brevundimonas sp. VNH65 TaxID=3400917 RepID=UPI003C05FCFD